VSMLLGAKELGIEVNWRYAFLGQDDTAATTPGVVFIELGGKVAPGVFDHHQGDQKDTCAAEVVFRNPDLAYGHLLGPWLARQQEGRLQSPAVFQPTVVTHRDPDWDSVVATYLVQRLVEDGGFPPEVDALVKYTRLVDQGKIRLFGGRSLDDWSAEILSRRPEVFAPHAGYLAIQNLRDFKGDQNEAKLTLGLELVQKVLDDLKEAAKGRGMRVTIRDFQPAPTPDGSDHPATLWAKDPRFAKAADLLREDAWRYDEDREQQDETRTTVLLPAEDGGNPIQVPAFVLKGPSKSRLNKYWVRAGGKPFFICPYDRGERPDTEQTPEPGTLSRVILSLDPGWASSGRKPTLRGLGFRLEKKESTERTADGREDERGLPARFPAPYCDNADPWYDGRAHDYTIVDAPMSGTKLSYSRIVEMACGSGFWKLPLEQASAVEIHVRPEAGPLVRPDGLPRAPLSFASTMESYLRDSFVVPLEELPGAGAFAERRYLRSVEGGAAFPLEVTHIELRGRASLDDLADRVGDAPGKDGPDYRLIRMRLTSDFLGAHFLAPSRLVHLFRKFDCSAPEDLASLAGKDVIIFSGRVLVLAADDEGGADLDLENLLYAVFLSESLAAFSRQIAGRVPGGEQGAEGASRLREAFIRFQTRHYQIDVNRRSRGRQLFEFLSEILKLPAHYAEVQSELDRLSELEERDADQRRKRAEAVLGAVLFFVAGFGALQTVVALFGWKDPWTFLGPACLGVFLATLAAYLFARRKLGPRDAAKRGGQPVVADILKDMASLGPPELIQLQEALNKTQREAGTPAEERL
jgi:hypothetical protein